MRKTYKMLIALAVTLLSGLNAMAQEQELVELEAEMFKSWSSPDADAVPTEETAVAEDGECGCAYALYEQLGAGSMVYGHTNVYYLWYANLTGTKKMYFEGTAGVQLRILMNRPVPVEGGDSHGGSTLERNVTIGDDGKAELDVSDLEYVHLNAIKTGWGSPAGTIRSIKLEGTVKPVSGWINQLENSDMEGEDVSCFIVALNASTDPGTHPATIVAGAGKDNSRGIVVESVTDPKETWETQFFVRMPEPLAEGTQWRFTMDYRADAPAESGSGIHVEPRAYKGGSMFASTPTFTTDWQLFEAEGTINADQAGMQSIAFDLNVFKTANKYYFDNVKFETFKEKSPMAQISAAFETDVVAIDFGGNTNIKDLVGNKKRVIFPNDCAKVTVDGQPTTLYSVEAKADGKLYVFIEEGYPEDNESANVLVSFTNPTDAAYHLTFTTGRWEGQDVPSFTDIAAAFVSGVGDNFTFKADAPELVSADPENGSFNLPVDMKEFKVVFDNNADGAQMVAKLDNETLTVSPQEFAKEFTLTRTGSNDLSTGLHFLTITSIKPEVDWLGLEGDVTLELSFGKVEADPNDTVRVVYKDNFAEYNNNVEPGWIVTSDGDLRQNGDGYGSGCRVITGKTGDLTAGIYLATRGRSAEDPAYASYGEVEEYPLTLTAGKYQLSLNATRWDKDGNIALKACVLDPEGNVVIEELKNVEPKASDNTVGATKFELKFNATSDGNYVLKFFNCMWDGKNVSYAGYDDCVYFGNIELKYIPSVVGVAETLMLQAALDEAKAALAAADSTRYDGTDKDELKAAIAKYDGATFTAPSAYINGTSELKVVTQKMNDHRVLCDNYDKQVEDALEAVAKYAESKFAVTTYFADLKTTVEKYDELLLTDNDQLTAATTELNTAVNNANGMFTEGESKCNMTGYATILERIRLGIADAKALGVAEDNAVLVEAGNALSDGDDVAQALKNVVKAQLYSGIDALFEPVINEETLEETTPTYDMTVFVKNPNIYILGAGNSAFTEETVPGWITPEGFQKPGMTSGWSTVGSAEVPCDGMFQTWGGSYRVEQTITDLPAGVYTLTMGFGERMSEEEATYDSFIYAKTSTTPDSVLNDEGVNEEAFAAKGMVKNIGQSYPYLNNDLTDIVVTDGVLTIGVDACSNSHTFFNDVRLVLTAKAAGFDYAAAAQELANGIETVGANGKVVRAEFFDLNGRRVNNATRGFFIVKKQMNDGSVRTEKVVVK